MQLQIDVFDALSDVTGASRQKRIPKRLPIHIIAGSCDPISAETRALIQLLAAYRANGLERVTHRFYPGARHEPFNEPNRDEVTRDLLEWLDGVTGWRRVSPQLTKPYPTSLVAPRGAMCFEPAPDPVLVSRFNAD